MIFASGCEFLVCRKEITEDEIHIYIREVEFGIGNAVVLWVDDKAREAKFFKHRLWIRMRQHENETFNLFNKFVIKTSNFTAEAYLNSNLFKYTIKICDSFKII